VAIPFGMIAGGTGAICTVGPLILHALAAPAGVLQPYFLNHLQPGWLDIELLGDVLPNHALDRPTPALLVLFGDVVDDPLAGEILRKRLTASLLRARVSRNDDVLLGLFCLPFAGHQLGFVEEVELPAFCLSQLFALSPEELVFEILNLIPK
jgi:hypothetical protein